MNLVKFNINLLSKTEVFAKDDNKKKTDDLKGYMLSYIEINADNETKPYGVSNSIFVPKESLPKDTYESFGFLDPLVLTLSMGTSISKNLKVLSVLKNDEPLKHSLKVVF